MKAITISTKIRYGVTRKYLNYQAATVSEKRVNHANREFPCSRIDIPATSIKHSSQEGRGKSDNTIK